MLRINPGNAQADGETDRSSIDGLALEVGTALDNGELDRAYSLLAQMIESGPASAQVHTTAGLVATQLDRPADAGRHLAHALRLAPDDFDTNYNLALSEIRDGRYQPALRRFRHLRRLYPDNADLLNDIGVLWQLRNQSARALAAFSQALKLDPNHSMARNNAMELCLQTSLTDRARRLLARQAQAIDLSPKSKAEIDRWLQVLDDPDCILEDGPGITGQEQEN